MKFFSSYVNGDLEFGVVEKQDPISGKKLLLIKHDSLRDIVYNQLEITKKHTGSVKYNYVSCDINHAVVECTINDGEGRVITELGEAVPSTLESEISRAYPVLIAQQRAFDRAVILLLKLTGKQLSSQELSEGLSIDFEPAVYAEKVIENNNIVQEQAMEEVQDDTNEFFNIPEGFNDVDEDYEPEPVVATSGIQVNDRKIDRLEEIGNKVFGCGKYKDKPDTYAQIYKNDVAYFRNLLKIPTPAAEIKDAIALVKEYVSLMGM